MAWYAWLGFVLLFAWGLAVTILVLTLLAAFGALHKRIEQTIQSLFAVAKNVDERFLHDEKGLQGVAQFLVEAFGLEARLAEAPKSGSVGPPPGELKN